MGKPVLPRECDVGGVQCVMGQNQPRLLLGCEPVFDQREITILIPAVNLVADDGMSEMGKMNADLVLAA